MVCIKNKNIRILQLHTDFLYLYRGRERYLESDRGPSGFSNKKDFSMPHQQFSDVKNDQPESNGLLDGNILIIDVINDSVGKVIGK